MTIYAKRRQKLLSLIPNGLALISAGTNKTRSNDTEYTFRQDSNFQYLTDFEEDGALVVICSKHESFKSVLFVTPKKPTMELWTGKRCGVEQAKKDYDFDEVFSIEDLAEELPKLFDNHKKLYLDIYNDKNLLHQCLDICKPRSQRRRKPGDVSPEEFINVIPTLGRLRLIKDQDEIDAIKKATQITAKSYQAIMSAMKPGMNESDLNAILEYFFRRDGGSGPAYGNIIASGDNANTLHYVKNNQEINDGQLVLFDAGAEFQHYACDVSRTIPANGKFSEAQKELYQLVLNALNAAINAAMPGKTLLDIHNTATKVLIEGMVELKILTGDPKEIEEKGDHRKYFPHGTSHWLGIDVHDNTPYLSEDGKRVKLTKGMIFTVEPGIYLPENDQEIPEKYRGIGIRIEDDILITSSGNENLTKDIPKEIADIETACAADNSELFQY